MIRLTLDRDIIEIYDPFERVYVPCKIIHSEILPNRQGEFLLVEGEWGDTAVISYTDGVAVTTDDWQGAQPKNLEEVPEFRWMDSQGRPCVMLGGLPRVLR